MFKRLLRSDFNQSYLDLIILLLRVSIACFMLTHGWKKMDALLYTDGPIKFSDPVGIGAGPSLALTVFAEVICSCFLLFGFLTRMALIPLITTMLVAVLFVHLSAGFKEMEFALLYLLIYLTLFITGGGKYSIDYFISGGSLSKE